MFVPINPWGHYIAKDEMSEINYSGINGTVLLVIYTILNCVLYVAAYYIPQEWNCRCVIFGISVFISILGIVFWAIEIKQFVRNNKNYERVCSMIKIIKAQPVPKELIECANCGSVLEYGNADLELHQGYMTRYKYRFKCPVCGVFIDAKWIEKKNSRGV